MNKRYLLSLLIILAFAGCNKTAEPQEPEDDTVSFYAGFVQDQASTKVTYKEVEHSFKLAWVKGDKVGVYSTGQSNYAYKADNNAPMTSFSYDKRSERIKWLSDTEPQSFYAYYPYSENAGADPHKVQISVPSVQSQTYAASIDHLAELDFMWTATENIIKSENGKFALTFHHAFSILELEFTTDVRMVLDALIFRCKSNPEAPVAFENGTIDLSTGEIDLTDAEKSSQIRIDCNFATSWPAPTHIKMIINPDLGGETMELVAVIGGTETVIAEKVVPQQGLPAGKVITVKTDFDVPDDVAVQVKDLSELAAANTYIVNKSNEYYSFDPTVKGNGFIPSELSAIDNGARIEPKSVLVLWYNTVQDSDNWKDECPILLSSLILYRNRIFFDTPKTFIPGNVVIAAFAEEGITYDNIKAEGGLITNATLLWSWNIWAAEGYDPETSNFKAGEWTIMDRNLGAAAGYEDLIAGNKYHATSTIGNLYEWGRKDPFPHFHEYSTTVAGQYNSLYTTPTYTPVVALQRNGVKGNLDKQLFYPQDHKRFHYSPETVFGKDYTNEQILPWAAEHPYIFLGNTGDPYTYTYNWNRIDEAGKMLWGDRTANDDIPSVKTYNDPCPPGWKVWSEATLYAMDEAGKGKVTSNRWGAEICGSYFPFNGNGYSKAFSTGWVVPVQAKNEIGVFTSSYDTYSGTWGISYYWQTETNNPEEGCPMNFIKASNGSSAGTSNARNVRCVKEN